MVNRYRHIGREGTEVESPIWDSRKLGHRDLAEVIML